jgi:hypothetical protein
MVAAQHFESTYRVPGHAGDPPSSGRDRSDGSLGGYFGAYPLLDPMPAKVWPGSGSGSGSGSGEWPSVNGVRCQGSGGIQPVAPVHLADDLGIGRHKQPWTGLHHLPELPILDSVYLHHRVQVTGHIIAGVIREALTGQRLQVALRCKTYRRTAVSLAPFSVLDQ